MTKLPDDQNKLLAFLQEYRPLPPPTPIIAPEEFKAKLTVQRSPSKTRVWLVPTAIAASLMVAWGAERVWLAKSQALDRFVMESWKESVEADWQYSFLEP